MYITTSSNWSEIIQSRPNPIYQRIKWPLWTTETREKGHKSFPYGMEWTHKIYQKGLPRIMQANWDQWFRYFHAYEYQSVKSITYKGLSHLVWKSQCYRGYAHSEQETIERDKRDNRRNPSVVLIWPIGIPFVEHS